MFVLWKEGQACRRRRLREVEVTGQLFCIFHKSIATRLLSTNSTASVPTRGGWVEGLVGGGGGGGGSWTPRTLTERNVTMTGWVC